VLDDVRFWLDRGVDGLRLDAINFCFHDAQLRDNPAKPPAQRTGRGFRTDNPYAFQHHRYDSTQPENLGFLEELRAVLDRYPNAVSLGEISSEDSLATMAEYLAPRRLHMGYCFELLTSDFSAKHIRATLSQLEAKLDGGWPALAISNHDVERVVTRWGGRHPPAQLANQLTALVCSLRGSACIYQGEELGLTEADVPFENLRDPYGLTFWPSFKGRDGCRTPMPWDESEHGGFTRAKPWLPTPHVHRVASVATQSADPSSTLNGVRAFLEWRRSQPALRFGSIRFLDVPEPILAFVRTWNEHAILAVFNLANEPVASRVYDIAPTKQLDVPGIAAGWIRNNELHLPAHGALFAHIERQ
jgi:alpha-glucosidase